MDNLKNMEEDIVNKLLTIKEEYRNTKDQLLISIRKDILLTELKDMLMENHDFYSLKNAIEDYIRNLEEDLNEYKKY